MVDIRNLSFLNGREVELLVNLNADGIPILVSLSAYICGEHKTVMIDWACPG